MKVRFDTTHGRGWFVYCGGNKYLHLDGVPRAGIFFLGKENAFWDSHTAAKRAMEELEAKKVQKLQGIAR